MVFIVFIGLFSCQTKKYFKENLGLTQQEYNYIKKNKELRDTVIHYSEILEPDRIKYRLDKYLDKTYNWKKFYSSLQLETIFGKDFEFNDSIPKDSPRFNNLDSLREHEKKMRLKIEDIVDNVEVKIDTLQ